MILEQHYLACLSQASYLIGDERTRTATVVDPRRDVEEYLQSASSRGLTIRHVLLTHFHADFISGHLELRQATGAGIYLGAAAAAEYPFTPLADGDEIDLGDVRIRAMETPGQTPESVCYLVFDRTRDPGRPHAVLTGDTLFVGDVGRPDLMASRGVAAEDLAGRLYDSLRGKILPLPDETILYPGHGAGSACGKSLGKETSCTIGRQRQVNDALQPMSREAFIGLVTAGLPAAPRYFGHDARLNREMRPLLSETVDAALRPLTIEEVLILRSRGARILDVRSPWAFADSHLSGSINVGLDGRFASWAGTVLDPGESLVLVADPGREREALIRLGRVGLDRVQGYLDGGIGALQGRPGLRAGFRRWSPADLAAGAGSARPPLVLDVRAPGERSGERIAGSLHIPLADLRDRAGELPRHREIVVQCGTGYRSAIAASLLLAQGLPRVGDLEGGFEAWKAAGQPVVGGAAQAVTGG
jgi:glyoxylase-like metal-dependent hydrolase (beta-lactamase superfamily II)/rhodanese-related sulfurtransferase